MNFKIIVAILISVLALNSVRSAPVDDSNELMNSGGNPEPSSAAADEDIQLNEYSPEGNEEEQDVIPHVSDGAEELRVGRRETYNGAAGGSRLGRQYYGNNNYGGYGGYGNYGYPSGSGYGSSQASAFASASASSNGNNGWYGGK